MMTIPEARALFPSGLFQPEASFRFSADALHLADFALSALKGGENVADLGAGCGVIGLALLLHRETLRVVAVEREEILAEAARINAARLGLARHSIVCGDVADRKKLLDARGQITDAPCPNGPPLFDAVVCNPPWRTPGAGRSSPSPLRRAALEADQGFSPFLFAADMLLAVRGALFLAVSAEKIPQVLHELPARLRPVRLRFVHPLKNRTTSPATLALLEARKGSRAALVVEAPLLCPPRDSARCP